MAKGKPFTPQPGRPGMRVRLEDDGPWIDLGISHSALLVGLLDTVTQLCDHSAGVFLNPALAQALARVNALRPKKGKP